MSLAKFKTFGRLDGSRSTAGTVVIDRASGLFSVRPARRRRVYTLPLATVAEFVCVKIIKAEIAERKAAKRSAKTKRTRRVGGER